MPAAFSPRSAAFVAFSCGSLSSVLVRPGRSGAAWVLVAGFESLSSASAFARRAAIRSGRSVALRPGAGGAAGEWSVSCPVFWQSSRGPAGGVACCLWWVGSAACPPPWRALGCLMCNSAVRCSSCPPSSPAGAPVPLVRCAPVARWFAPCPLCGALGLVLVTSGAARPFLWCAWCGVAAPAPARSRWSPSREPAAVQPSLF